jgi:hypothetical protein
MRIPIQAATRKSIDLVSICMASWGGPLSSATGGSPTSSNCPLLCVYLDDMEQFMDRHTEPMVMRNACWKHIVGFVDVVN